LAEQTSPLINGQRERPFSASLDDAVMDPMSPLALQWRALSSFTVYRLLIAILLVIGYWGFNRLQIVGAASPVLATPVLFAYSMAAITMFVTAKMRVPSSGIHLTTQVLIDVAGLTLLMTASGGARSGIGLLLLVTLAAAGLVSRGRMVFFHAALAALAVLAEQSWQFLQLEAPAGEFVPAGLLAGSFFVMGGLGHTLAKYAAGAEKIAEARGVDLANMAEINQLVIRDMQDGFVVVDESGVIRQHNEQSEHMIAGLKDSANRKILEVAPQLAGLLAQWRKNHSRIFPMVRDAVTQIDYQVRFVAVGEKDPAPTVVFIEDAGRIRSQAQQMKLVALGRLTASIAHEIRNPLSSINHAAELLQEDEHRLPADARLLTIIQENSHRLDRMVQEVLNLNRRDRAHPEAIDAKEYLDQFMSEFVANEKMSPDVVKLTISTTRRIIFDRSHLDQILWNLTRNAYRHSKKMVGSVSVKLSGSNVPNMAKLTVIDDGPGVSTEALAHLFEPFFTTETSGTGLGLYIARELAEVNGARIEYIADRIPSAARGAEFCITLQLQ
jgi:two-component system, NtrC family, sensor histidine kinase PilS